MVIHSSTLAWEIPWREQPGGLQSTGVTKSRIRRAHICRMEVLLLCFLDAEIAEFMVRKLLQLALKAIHLEYQAFKGQNFKHGFY